MTTSLTRRAGLVALGGALAAPHGARAQAWPDRPIRIIVPAAPGGQGDLASRLVGEGLRAALGQPVVADNRVGGNGIIGVEYTARQPADGYTLVYGVVGVMIINPLYDPRLNVDVMGDFAPVTQMGISPQALFVRPSLPAATLEEFIAHAKANPGKLTFASIGAGSISHINGEVLKLAAGIDMLHVPFRGAAPAIQELLAGRVDAMVIDFAAALQPMRDGMLRALAVTGPQRWPQVPDVPTFVERGLEALRLVGWGGIFAPAGTPAPLVELLAEKINAFVRDPANRERLITIGLLPTGTTPAAFRDIIQSDIASWRQAIQSAGIQPE